MSAHTPGPWRWEINLKSRGLQLVGGVPKFDLIVVDPVRWGTNGASLRFRQDIDGLNLMDRAEKYAVPVVGREHHAAWFQGLRHPDAQIIEAAPDLLDALKDVALIMRAHPDVFEEFAGEPWTGRVESAIAKAEGR